MDKDVHLNPAIVALALVLNSRGIAATTRPTKAGGALECPPPAHWTYHNGIFVTLHGAGAGGTGEVFVIASPLSVQTSAVHGRRAAAKIVQRLHDPSWSWGKIWEAETARRLAPVAKLVKIEETGATFDGQKPVLAHNAPLLGQYVWAGKIFPDECTSRKAFLRPMDDGTYELHLSYRNMGKDNNSGLRDRLLRYRSARAAAKRISDFLAG
ncbi:MAG: hypothetical protein KC925_02345 [Candidatus Doudnabacteria bacterium]|nr:hypothetical protein [Candidatus Doudnabacteria bacterium]